MSRLSGIADLFLLHNREIVQRSDDSVVRRIGRRPYPIRRARGFFPAPIVLRRCRVPKGRAGVAGVGGELKNTFCFIKENFAYLSQHIGDMDSPTARDFFSATFSFFRDFLEVELDAVCHDLHPAYFTTSFAAGIPASRVLSLQHHKAHLFALMAEPASPARGRNLVRRHGIRRDGRSRRRVHGDPGDGDEAGRGAWPVSPSRWRLRRPRDTWKPALALLSERSARSEGRKKAISCFRKSGDGSDSS
jgi:hypothetical protein